MYRIIILPNALSSLSKIDKPIVERIVAKLNWLSENIKDTTLLPLRSNLSGFYKIRVGDWRVIYDVDHDKKEISVHKIGHRRDIYIS